MAVQLASTVLMCLLLSTSLVAGAGGCPSPCVCKWRNGKQTVDCASRSLLIIPDDIDPTTQVLDVSGNEFRHLHNAAFQRKGLINLQKLYLSRCFVEIIERDAFVGLTKLVELDLTGNLLETVPTEALLNCPTLMKLGLGKNPIRSLDRLAFNHLSFLTTLDLSGCEITEVDAAAFASLYGLEWVDLSGNKLRNFPDVSLFPSRIKGVQLRDNPWTCDCNVRPFNQWLKRNEVPILNQPVCRLPARLAGVAVKSLEEEELLCVPQVYPTSSYFELEEGKNVSLVCQVKSNPPAKVSWLFKEQTLSGNNTGSDSSSSLSSISDLRLLYAIEQDALGDETILFIYNLNLENNGTFWCVAENPAGVSAANYTIMIIPKQSPVTLQENDSDAPSETEGEGRFSRESRDSFIFPFEMFSFLLAALLVCACLCLVALLMAVMKHQSNNKKRQQDEARKKSVVAPPSRVVKPILKKSSNFGYANDATTLDVDANSRNPDIINGIDNGDAGATNEILMHRGANGDVNGSGAVLNPFLPGATLGTNRQLRQTPATRTASATFGHRLGDQSYLNPTLIGTVRPVSAPSFERFVENYPTNGDHGQWSTTIHYDDVQL